MVGLAVAHSLLFFFEVDFYFLGFLDFLEFVFRYKVLGGVDLIVCSLWDSERVSSTKLSVCLLVDDGSIFGLFLDFLDGFFEAIGEDIDTLGVLLRYLLEVAEKESIAESCVRSSWVLLSSICILDNP